MGSLDSEDGHAHRRVRRGGGGPSPCGPPCPQPSPRARLRGTPPPPGVLLPWASTGSPPGRLPLGTTREGLPRTHGKAPVRQAAPRGPSVLGALPAAAGTPDLTDHAVPPADSATTADSTAVRNVMPASTLAADSAPGMGSASF